MLVPFDLIRVLASAFSFSSSIATIPSFVCVLGLVTFSCCSCVVSWRALPASSAGCVLQLGRKERSSSFKFVCEPQPSLLLHISYFVPVVNRRRVNAAAGCVSLIRRCLPSISAHLDITEIFDNFYNATIFHGAKLDLYFILN